MTDNPDSGVKYFLGTAAYEKSFDVPAGWLNSGQHLMLDLGEVRELAEVSVNGRSLASFGTISQSGCDACAEVRSEHLGSQIDKPWVNRLIGDQQLGATQ